MMWGNSPSSASSPPWMPSPATELVKVRPRRRKSNFERSAMSFVAEILLSPSYRRMYSWTICIFICQQATAKHPDIMFICWWGAFKKQTIDKSVDMSSHSNSTQIFWSDIVILHLTIVHTGERFEHSWVCRPGCALPKILRRKHLSRPAACKRASAKFENFKCWFCVRLVADYQAVESHYSLLKSTGSCQEAALTQELLFLHCHHHWHHCHHYHCHHHWHHHCHQDCHFGKDDGQGRMWIDLQGWLLALKFPPGAVAFWMIFQ